MIPLRPFVPRLEEHDSLVSSTVVHEVERPPQYLPEELRSRLVKHETAAAGTRRIVPRMRYHGIGRDPVDLIRHQLRDGLFVGVDRGQPPRLCDFLPCPCNRASPRYPVAQVRKLLA